MSGLGTSKGRTMAKPNRNNIKYGRVAQNEDTPGGPSNVHTAPTRNLNQHLKTFQSSKRRQLIIMSFSILGCFFFLYLVVGANSASRRQECDSFEVGYQCRPEISHYWGQYSPYFTVPSAISSKIPDECQITFAQVLSRHGARDPTSSKTKLYNATVELIHSEALSYGKGYEFIKDYQYTLGADQLTGFGQQQMINSGKNFFNRYKKLALGVIPFIRSSGQDRVLESALNWTQGFHDLQTQHSPDQVDYPYYILTIPEGEGSNNTLSHSLCTGFEDGAFSDHGDEAQGKWAAIFTPPITARLRKNLPGVNLTQTQTIYIMDLCPFNTIASEGGNTISPFCSFFTEQEWNQYDYYQSLGKYYGYGWGNPLGPTQGVGFANELLARLTNTPVSDHTSTNSTLDSSRATFPLGGSLFADFSHDNDMIAIYAALGLYNSTRPLLNTTIEDVGATEGFSSSWTAPFAARVYFEKMTCVGAEEEYVRVLVNDRVLPLEICGGDGLGRCKLSSFVDVMSFARGGGHWDQCFV